MPRYVFTEDVVVNRYEHRQISLYNRGKREAKRDKICWKKFLQDRVKPRVHSARLLKASGNRHDVWQFR